MPPPHDELKLHHDHKDIDLYVVPENFRLVLERLNSRGYQHIWSRFDRFSNEKSYRYEKFIEGDETVKILIDLFLQRNVPFVEVNGFKIVEPKFLLSLYRIKVHSTDDCTAVMAARKLVAKGLNPIGRKELIERNSDA